MGEINQFISTPEPNNSNNLTPAQQRQQTQEDSRPRVQHINI